MITNQIPIWFWLIVGFVPHRISRRVHPGGVRTLEIKALCWRFHLRQRPSGRHDWTLTIPLVERMWDAVWKTITELQEMTDGTE